MGNSGSSGNNKTNRNHNYPTHAQNQHPPPPLPQPEMTGNRYVFAAASPYPQQQQPYYQYPCYPCAPMPWNPTPYVEHQKAVTIRNNVNLKKETLRVELDEENLGRFLIAFIFDATVVGSITDVFFAKEGLDRNLTPMREGFSTVHNVFSAGSDSETELMKEGDMEVFPSAVKAEASPPEHDRFEGENPAPGAVTYHITQAVFEKEKSEYKVRVVKKEIYGIGNTVDNDLDGNDPGKECVICLSEPRDTIVLLCRHMCMCNGCAKVLRFQTNRCPICH
ncbi:hypothetical protein MKX01_000584 [Papaver californicum]|nr:hypothetical protein MKX01_000584 [Papaver californicum]